MAVVKKARMLTLYDCLRLYFAKTRLVGDDQVFCARCGSRQDCDRTLHITHAPRYICIDLKRFRHDGHNADSMQVGV
eukprot:COSAG02_NODE_20991_length_807_cov_0.837571_3_plen_77_part_00